VDDLLACAAAHLSKDARLREVTLAAGEGEAIAWLHQHGEVLHQESEGMETRLLVRISETEWERFESRRTTVGSSRSS
jgi:GTP-binding protein HflX